MRWLLSHPVPVDHDRVVAAIAAAEGRTSGEVRVLIARHRAKDPVAAAQRHFHRLGLGRAGRAGILIFLAPRSRSFAVIGDPMLHERCGETCWRELAAAMAGYFKRGDFTAGLEHGIARAGDLLADYFPREAAPGDPPEEPIPETD